MSGRTAQHLGVRVDPNTKKRIKALATAEARSVAQVVNIMLAHSLAEVESGRSDLTKMVRSATRGAEKHYSKNSN